MNLENHNRLSREKVSVLLKLSYILVLAIAIGSIGLEWSWSQNVTVFIYGPLYVAASAGIIFVAIKLRAFQAIPSINMKWLILLGWFILAIVIERFLSTIESGHTPFDVAYLRILFCYFLAAICGFIGLRIGGNSKVANCLFERVAFVLAAISVYIFFFGTPPDRDTIAIFPSQYVSFPMRLFCLFAFCWYLNKWFLEKKIFTWRLFGVAASALPTIVLFHKPIVFATLLSFVALIFLNIYRKMGVRTLGRVIILVLLSAIIFIIVNTASGGAALENLTQRFFWEYLHSNPNKVEHLQREELMERSAGGRFELWQNTWQNVSENPIFGSGLAQRSDVLEGVPIPIHNGYLDILASVGIFGAVAAVIAFTCFALAVMARLKTQDDTWLAPTLAYIVGIGAYNFGGTSNLFIFQSAFLLLCMGMIVAPIHRALSYEHERNR